MKTTVAYKKIIPGFVDDFPELYMMGFLIIGEHTFFIQISESEYYISRFQRRILDWSEIDMKNKAVRSCAPIFNFIKNGVGEIDLRGFITDENLSSLVCYFDELLKSKN